MTVEQLIEALKRLAYRDAEITIDPNSGADRLCSIDPWVVARQIDVRDDREPLFFVRSVPAPSKHQPKVGRRVYVLGIAEER